MRQREYDVAKLLRAKEQPVSLIRSHHLVTQNRERQLPFTGNVPRYNLKSPRSLVGSLGAQLYGLFCAAGTEREMQSPFRRQDTLETLEVHDNSSPTNEFGRQD